MINIILTDQHDLFRAGMRHLLSCYPDINLRADIATGKELLSILDRRLDLIVLLSTNIQDMSIISLIKKIKRDTSKVKLVILANELNMIIAKQYLIAGADSFIIKNLKEAEFVEVLKKIQQNKTVLPEKLTQNLAKKNINIHQASPFENLSEREMDILLLLVKGKSIKTISEILHLSPKTISTYKGRIFEKLNATSMINVFLLAIEHGLIRSQNIA